MPLYLIDPQALDVNGPHDEVADLRSAVDEDGIEDCLIAELRDGGQLFVYNASDFLEEHEDEE